MTRLLATSLLVSLTACATAGAPRTAADAPASGPAERPAWTPGPGAADALEGLYRAKPFQLPASRLVQASGGPVPGMHSQEVLLLESHVTLDQPGRAVEVRRTVWRILSDHPDQTQTFTWSPWRQERPRVRARVITAQGAESWVQETNFVEGSVRVDGLELSDVRQLSVALPNARLGSVVELEVVYTDTRPLLERAGSMGEWPLWSLEPTRRRRFSVEAPAGAPLKVEVVGVPTPTIETRGATQRFELEVAQLTFTPFALTRSELYQRHPRFSWSTAPSWEVVAARYSPLVEEALGDSVDLSAVTSLAARVASPTEKAQVVLRWLSDRVRYTALHLGAGAIVPTRPSVVLGRGFGDCKDMAVLAALALRRSGLQANVALVAAGGPGARDGLPGLSAFDHMIVALPAAPGKAALWIDPTAPDFPVGVVPASVRNQRALLIAPGTTLLTPTPTSEESPYAIRQIFELDAAPFGMGTAKATFEHLGAAEGVVRGAAGLCDADAAHKLAEGSVEAVLGSSPFRASLKGCKPGEGPVTLSVEMASAPALDTGDRSFEVRLPARIADLVIPDWVLGRAGGDARTDAKKQDDQKRLLARTGLTEAELERRALSFENRPSIERVYRLRLPPRFSVATLPANRTLPMGPSTWSETYRRLDEGTVEVRFAYRVDKADWSAGEVEQFHQAFRRRFEEPVLEVTAVFAPLQLLNEKKPAEAVALMKRWLTERPLDGPTRARYARVLLRLGLGDLAQREAERAVMDTPDDPLVLMVCADVARHDEFGLLYHPPFRRERSLECLRKAHRLLPDHTWPPLVLADTLRRNASGEKETGWSKDVAEAAALLRGVIDRHGVVKKAAGMLLEMYVAAGRQDDVKALLAVESIASSLREEGGTRAAVIEMLANGSEGVLRRSESAGDSKERLAAIALGYGALVSLRRYDDATAFLSRVPRDPAIEREISMLRAIHRGLARAPDSVDVSSPEAAARSVYAQISSSSSPTDAARRLSTLASASGRSEIDGTPRMFDLVRLPPVDQPFPFDQLYARGKCSVDAVEGATRVRCAVPENRAISSTTYWVTEGGKLRLESLGNLRQLSRLAWRAAEGGKPRAGGVWIGWYLDELTARETETSAAKLLRDFWSQANHGDPRAVRFAAAVAQVMYDDMAEKAPSDVMAELDQGRGQLSGALRRAADATLVRTLAKQKKYEAAAQALEPLARSENEPWMWQFLATLESSAGHFDRARARIDAALQRDASSPEWRQVKALLALRSGKYDEAVRTLEALEREKGAGINVRNNLHWARLMAGKLDDETERDTLSMANEKEAVEAELHTAAMVLLERGRVVEAAEIAEKLHLKLGAVPSGAEWLLRGRLLQLLDFTDLSHAAYARVGDDPNLTDLVRRFQGR